MLTKEVHDVIIVDDVANILALTGMGNKECHCKQCEWENGMGGSGMDEMMLRDEEFCWWMHDDMKRYHTWCWETWY